MSCFVAIYKILTDLFDIVVVKFMWSSSIDCNDEKLFKKVAELVVYKAI